jgi:hypothetical protein
MPKLAATQDNPAQLRVVPEDLDTLVSGLWS